MGERVGGEGGREKKDEYEKTKHANDEGRKRRGMAGQ
jgi:hypothetical protein